METQEMKQRIKDYFVEIKEDKFTKVKTIKCKHNITWKGKELENKFMLTKNSYSNELKMGIDYRHKDEVDSVFFTFIYTNSDGGYPGMTNIKMYLILDDDKNIELSEGSGFDHTSQSSKVGDNYISVYLETAQLAVSMSDFIAIANAKKIEYSIRFGQGSLENVFTQNDLLLFKGFYNSSFDAEFEQDNLNTFSSNDGFTGNTIFSIYQKEGKLAAVKKYQEITGKSLSDATNYVSRFDTKVKEAKLALYNDPIEKYFLTEDRFKGDLFNKNDTINFIQTDKGITGNWSNTLVNQVIFNDLKVGIKHNSQAKAPTILIFPNAFVYNKGLKIFQIDFSNIKRVDIKKGIIDTTILVDDDKDKHKIDITANADLANFIVSFINLEISKEHEKVNYINSDNQVHDESQKIKDSFIKKYSISEPDLKRLKEIEKEKSELGLFSMKKEKLKAESMRILKPYNVKFMDLGMLLNEIKNN